MLKVILWDIDGTLLNFAMSERYAIRACFERFHLGECTDEMLERYSVINLGYWKRLERQEITREQVLNDRFRQFFGEYGIICKDVAAFNREYQLCLGDKIFFMEDGYELVKRLRGRVKQYAVTNGTRSAQERKLQRSGLDQLFDGVFISEQVGADKPSLQFFETVWREIGPYRKGEIAIVGDSLTSDMQGGNNAGILCFWYNPDGAVNDRDIRIDREMRSLWELEDLIATEKQ